MRPVWGAQINDRQCKSLICKESENDTFRFPQINIGSQKAAIRPFATLSILNDDYFKQQMMCSKYRT
jgi:hypothetical protein